MSEQLFREIRSIEQQAENILSDSEKQGADIVKKARAEAAKLLSKRESDLKEIRNVCIKDAVNEAAKLKEKKLEKSEKALNELRVSASKRKDEAANLILKRLSELIGE